MVRTDRILVRHDGEVPRERSSCGWRDRLISREDAPMEPAAWAHAVDIDGAEPHYHKVATELYYVLDGNGTVTLDGVEHEVPPGFANPHPTERRPQRKGTHASTCRWHSGHLRRRLFPSRSRVIDRFEIIVRKQDGCRNCRVRDVIRWRLSGSLFSTRCG